MPVIGPAPNGLLNLVGIVLTPSVCSAMIGSLAADKCRRFQRNSLLHIFLRIGWMFVIPSGIRVPRYVWGVKFAWLKMVSLLTVRSSDDQVGVTDSFGAQPDFPFLSRPTAIHATPWRTIRYRQYGCLVLGLFENRKRPLLEILTAGRHFFRKRQLTIPLAYPQQAATIRLRC